MPELEKKQHMNSYFSMGQWLDNNSRLVNQKIRTQHNPCMFYHVSSEPLTPLEYDERPFVMHPQLIKSGEWTIETVKRICVAPTVEQCILAIATKADPNFYIYRTVRSSTQSYLPFGVFDSPLTQERWFRSKRTFKLVGIVPSDRYWLYDINERYRTEYLPDYRGSAGDFPSQHRELHRLRRFFKRHESGFFMNPREVQIHRQQRTVNRDMNRRELKTLMEEYV